MLFRSKGFDCSSITEQSIRLYDGNGRSCLLYTSDGDVMIHTPKFYGKSGSNGNKRWVRISTVKVDTSWVEIPEMFISAYRITTFLLYTSRCV